MVSPVAGPRALERLMEDARVSGVILGPGAGIKGGTVHGASDDFGFTAVENKVHVHDLHATILHLMGLDHKRLIHRFKGLDVRLTNLGGNVIESVFV